MLNFVCPLPFILPWYVSRPVPFQYFGCLQEIITRYVFVLLFIALIFTLFFSCIPYTDFPFYRIFSSFIVWLPKFMIQYVMVGRTRISMIFILFLIEKGLFIRCLNDRNFFQAIDILRSISSLVLFLNDVFCPRYTISFKASTFFLSVTVSFSLFRLHIILVLLIHGETFNVSSFI